jgi:hypothetical protein
MTHFLYATGAALRVGNEVEEGLGIVFCSQALASMDIPCACACAYGLHLLLDH